MSKECFEAQCIQNQAKRSIVLGISTGFGVGYMPVAPGTFGSLLGIPLGLWLIQFPTWIAFGVCLFLLFLFSYCAEETCKHRGQWDSQIIVSDEILGQAIALLGLRLSVPLTDYTLFDWTLRLPPWGYVLSAFLLFRILDIVKPYPAKMFDRQTGGFATIADDVVAGLYASLVLWGFARITQTSNL